MHVTKEEETERHRSFDVRVNYHRGVINAVESAESTEAEDELIS